MSYTVGELFAGIGGFSLAFHAAGLRTAWFVEKEPFCQQVLQKNFPGVPIHGDIYECHELPYVDIITAGFPCQPFSMAGKRQGVNDERYLVPEMLRVISEVQPRVCIFENVPGFTNIAAGDTFKQFLRALAESGYDAEWDHFRASDRGAPHQRERWFCVAYRQNAGNGRQPGQRADRRQPLSASEWAGLRTGLTKSGQVLGHHPITRLSQPRQARQYQGNTQSKTGLVPKSERSGVLGNDLSIHVERQRSSRKQIAPTRHHQTQPQSAGHGTGQQSAIITRLDRVTHGLSAWMDRPQWPARPGEPQYSYEPPRVTSAQPQRTARLKALGNSVVPQVVYPIACAIREWLDAQAAPEAGEVA